MATASGQLTTTAVATAVVGMREELGDDISLIDRDETPAQSWFGDGTCRNTVAHEWPTVSLRAPRRQPTPEGNVATNSTPKTIVRLKNAAEIIQEQYAVSGTVEAANVVDGAGKLDFQRAMKGKELKKDLEIAILGPQDYEVADPREMAGVQAYAANYTVGTGGTAPDGTGNTAVVYGTEQALDTDLINSILHQAWVDGARISLFHMSGAQKLAFDTAVPVDSVAESQVDVTDLSGATVVTTVAVWKSTFGQIKFVMNGVLDEQGGWGQQCIIGFDERPSYRPKLCPMPGRNWLTERLGKRGDLTEELMTWEGTIEVQNPKSVVLIGSLSDAYAS